MSNLKIFRQQWSLLALLLWLLGFGISTQSFAYEQVDDEAKIRALVEKYFSAYQKKDLNSLLQMWSDKSTDFATNKQSLEKTFADNDKMEIKNLSIRAVILHEDTATVRLSFESNASATKSGDVATFATHNRTLNFIKQLEWKIVQAISSEREFAFALVAAKTDDERKALFEKEKWLINFTLAKELTALGIEMFNKGSSMQAVAHFQLALGVAKRLDDLKSAAIISSSLAASLYYLGNYTQALDHALDSLSLAEKINDNEAINMAANNLGLIYEAQGDYAKALKYYEKSLKFAEGFKDEATATLNNMGNVYIQQGSYLLALEYLQKSLKLGEEIGSIEAIANALHSIGYVHELQGNLTQALAFYEKSLKLSDTKDFTSKGLVPTTLDNLGSVYEMQGNYQKALEYLFKGLKLAEELGDKQLVASLMNSVGTVFKSQGNYSEALKYFQKSIELSTEIGAKNKISEALYKAANLYALQGNYVKAIELANQSATIAREVGIPDILWKALTIAGKAYRGLKQTDKVRSALSEAIDTVEKIRGQIAGGENERQRFFESKVEPYYELADLLVEQSHDLEALAYAERAKGRVLLDTIQSGKINVSKAMSRQEQEEERNLRRELISLNTQLTNESLQQKPDEARLAELHTTLQKTRNQFEAFQMALYIAHPGLQTQRGDIRSINLEDVGQLLPDARTALLEFVVREDKSFLFVLTKKNNAVPVSADLRVYLLPVKQKELTQTIHLFTSLMANRSEGYKQAATKLYDLLLKPAQAQLRRINQIVIVPDGVLWELPFQALQSSPNRFLVQDYAISYVPSLTILREMTMNRARQNKANADAKALLALGNPDIGKETYERVTNVFMSAALDPLPEAERQVKALGQMYGTSQSKIYTGTDAREERVKREAHNYKILHLATHGVLNDASPMYSHLVLSQSKGDVNEDGLLEAWEILNMDLNAELVVLSACDTARGKVGAGEGVIGLSWALFVAGCPSVVVSQWKVESSSTTELMLAFHRNLRASATHPKLQITKAEAMRQAALKLLRSKEYKHPFYWAAFVVIGNNEWR